MFGFGFTFISAFSHFEFLALKTLPLSFSNGTFISHSYLPDGSRLPPRAPIVWQLTCLAFTHIQTLMAQQPSAAICRFIRSAWSAWVKDKRTGLRATLLKVALQREPGCWLFSLFSAAFSHPMFCPDSRVLVFWPEPDGFFFASSPTVF